MRRDEDSLERRDHVAGRGHRASRRLKRSSPRLKRSSHSGGARSSPEGPRSSRVVRAFDGPGNVFLRREEHSFERRDHPGGRGHRASRRLKRSSRRLKRSSRCLKTLLPHGRSSFVARRTASSRVVRRSDGRRTSSHDETTIPPVRKPHVQRRWRATPRLLQRSSHPGPARAPGGRTLFER